MKHLDDKHNMCYNIKYMLIYAVLIALFSVYIREN